jgi:hypothetical protein
MTRDDTSALYHPSRASVRRDLTVAQAMDRELQRFARRSFEGVVFGEKKPELKVKGKPVEGRKSRS